LFARRAFSLIHSENLYRASLKDSLRRAPSPVIKDSYEQLTEERCAVLGLSPRTVLKKDLYQSEMAMLY